MKIGPFPLLDFIILFGGCLALLVSFAQAIRPNKKFGNWYFCSVFVVTGLLMFYFYGHYARPGFDYTFRFAPAMLILLFSIGPIHYISAYKVLIRERKFKFKDLLHGIPALAASLISIIYGLGDPLLSSLPWLAESRAVNIIHYALTLCWIIHFFLYETVLAARFFLNARREGIHKNMMPALSSVIYGMIVAIVLSIAHIFLLTGLTLIVIASLTLDVIAWYFFTYLYPDTYPSLNAAIGRHELMHTKNLDRSLLYRKLMELMEKEKMFCDEDLTLTRLASMVAVSGHQLSEFLNRELSMSFKQFINHYRIEEAKKLLVSETDRPTLSVGMAVGFNSKSVFYTTFTKHTGTSPQAYRDKQTGNKTGRR